DGIRDKLVTGVQTCALPIFAPAGGHRRLTTRRPTARRLVWCGLVAVELDQPLVRDPEEVGDLVHDGVADAFAELRLGAHPPCDRSEERRVGKEGGSWGSLGR